MNKEQDIPQSVNKEPEIYVVKFWDENNPCPTLSFKATSWCFLPENNKILVINYFQDITMVNVERYDYITCGLLPI